MKSKAYVEIEKINWKAVFIIIISLFMIISNLYLDMVLVTKNLFIDVLSWVVFTFNTAMWVLIFIMEGIFEIKYIEKISVKVRKK